jgi:hypothetical protein
MPNKSANVVSGRPLATGGILIAPVGTEVPADSTTSPGVLFVGAGYIGEDGVTEMGERSPEKIKAWGGETVKVVQTEHSLMYSFSFIETLNADVLKAIYGDANVTTTAATISTGTIHKVLVTGDSLPRKSYVFEIKDGDARIRIVVPNGQITEVGDITYSDSEVIAYEVTIHCFADANGVKATKYLDNGIFSS